MSLEEGVNPAHWPTHWTTYQNPNNLDGPLSHVFEPRLGEYRVCGSNHTSRAGGLLSTASSEQSVCYWSGFSAGRTGLPFQQGYYYHSQHTSLQSYATYSTSHIHTGSLEEHTAVVLINTGISHNMQHGGNMLPQQWHAPQHSGYQSPATYGRGYEHSSDLEPRSFTSVQPWQQASASLSTRSPALTAYNIGYESNSNVEESVSSEVDAQQDSNSSPSSPKAPPPFPKLGLDTNTMASLH